jgi:hypothetical protein
MLEPNARNLNLEPRTSNLSRLELSNVSNLEPDWGLRREDVVTTEAGVLRPS